MNDSFFSLTKNQIISKRIASEQGEAVVRIEGQEVTMSGQGNLAAGESRTYTLTISCAEHYILENCNVWPLEESM